MMHSRTPPRIRKVTVTRPTFCGTCNAAVNVDDVRSNLAYAQGGYRPFWMRCPVCGDGILVTKDGRLHPPASELPTIDGLQPAVEAMWNEICIVYASGSPTATEMLCRKLLMHVALNLNAHPSEGAPFTEYVDALIKSGEVSNSMKPVLESIRTRGNRANHDIALSTPEDAKQTADFTRLLLEVVRLKDRTP